jgi:UDP-GlcNAc:undecaprenyl-phosphate GlcNAc-1-phosphate transferase
MYLILTLGFISFVFSLLLTPVVRDAFRKWGLVDHPDQIRKRHASPTPRVGGIAIVISYLAAFGIVLSLPFAYRSVVIKALPDVWIILLAAAIVFATGLLDDLIGLKPWQKLIGQLVGASVAVAAGVQIHVGSEYSMEAWWSIPISLIWLLGCTNAFNLIDGLDGLAAGVGLFATITMLLAALTQNNLEMTLVTMPLVGCLFGFLRYNFNPASVFLGDCGSLLIGFLLGCFGVLWSQKSATLVGMTAPMMAMAIPLLDAALAVIRRFLRHQPIFGADREHIHHRLLDRGMTPKKAALLLYGICGLGAVLSLLANSVHNQFGGLIIILFCCAAWIGIQHLGYVEFGMARQMFFNGTFRRIIDTQTKLRNFQQALTAADTLEACWTALQGGGRECGFHSIRVNIKGMVRESVIRPDHGDESACWQLRIPLLDSQYVNFQHDLHAAVDPLLLGAFVKIVERTLNAKLSHLESEALTPSSLSGQIVTRSA